ncbi:MAG: tetratricopeptide repeat protein [Candidatus Korobacteraceae bacterium]
MSSVNIGAKKQKKAQPPHTGFVPSPGKQRLLLGLLLVVATIALYYSVGSDPFLNYDDDLYIVHNPHVHDGLHWATVAWAFTSFDASNWHPLTWLSHALDYQLFQMNPAGHHDVNLFLHVLNVLLLFLVLQRATGYAGRSALMAALFALHPINVESVAWVAERKNLLSMMFFLLALGAYRWYAQWVPQSSRHRREAGQIGRYSVVAVLFACGLMAKPQVITLPLVLLLWDYWPLRRMFATDPPTEAETAMQARSFSWLVLEKLPLLALSAASAVVTLIAQHESGAMSGPNWQPFPIRVENAIVAYTRYLGKALWPARLSLLYPHPGSSVSVWQVLAAFVLLVGITALTVAERHRRRYLLVGWLWFLGTLVPMIGLVQVGVQAMADRYAYLPFVGLFIMAVWTAAEWLAHKRVAMVWQTGVSVAALLALALTARQQLGYWSDNVKLWSRVVALEGQALHANPDGWVAENNLGHAFLNVGEEEQAIVHFRAAFALNHSDADSNLNIGAYEQGHNQPFAAIEQYKKVLAMTQSTARLNAVTRAQTFRNMGLAYRQVGDYGDARESFQQAVNLNPNDGESWLGLGIMAHKLGDLKTAIPAYSNALKVESLDWAYVLLAKALEQSGRNEEARAAMQKASVVSKNFEQTQRVAEKVLAQ